MQMAIFHAYIPCSEHCVWIIATGVTSNLYCYIEPVHTDIQYFNGVSELKCFRGTRLNKIATELRMYCYCERNSYGLSFMMLSC